MINHAIVSGSPQELTELRRENAELRARYHQLLEEMDSARERRSDQQNGQQQICESVLAHCSDLVQTLTLDGAVLSINRAGAEILKATHPDVVIGQPWITQWSVESHSRVRQALDKALGGAVAHFAGQMPVDQPANKLWSAVLAPVFNPYGKPQCLISITRYIPGSQNMQQSANETDERFRALADNMAQLAWMADEKGSVFWYNRRWYSYTGTCLDEMRGWGWRKVHHPDHLDRVVRKIRNAFATGQVWEDTFPLRHKDGKYRWFLSRAMPIHNADGKVVRWFGTATDITRQLMIQSRLRASEEKLRLGIAVARVAITEVDYASGTAELSERAAEIYGLPADQLVVAHGELRNLIHPDDRSTVLQLVHDAQRGAAAGKVHSEHRIVRRSDGQIRWLRVNEQIFFETDDHGVRHPATSLIATHDITDRKNVQSEQERARQLAVQASRAKSDFLANMSHEIRTPMTAILGYADILSRHLSDPDNLNCVRTIRRNGLYLLDIINDILDLSKIEEGRLEVEHVGFSPVALVEEIRSLMDVRAYEKRIPLHIDYETRLPQTIRCDPTRLRQILVNLVANAIKFTEKGAVRLAVRYLPENGKIEFSVIDSGIGISPDSVERLFQPFTQADSSTTRRYGGSGLGLTISQRLARLMGGDIRVHSELQRGSTFTLSIDAGCDGEDPLVDPTETVPIEQTLDENHLGQCIELNCKVLVVDDRRDVRFLVQYIIEEAGGTVRRANNGQHALEIIERANQKLERPIDLILMDLQMPKMGGLEATRRLRAGGYDKPVVALTANAMKGDRETCLAAGCTDYLTKPIDKQLLLETIARHVHGAAAGSPQIGDGFATRFREPGQPYLSPPPTEQRPAASAGTERPPADARRILLVEDQTDAGRMLQQYMELDGHEVMLVNTGVQAIEQAASWLPEVVIMDLGLPDLCGLEVARQLRRNPQLQQTRMIALTGRSSDSDRRESLAAGFDDHLLKPAELSLLEKLVRAPRGPV